MKVNLGSSTKMLGDGWVNVDSKYLEQFAYVNGFLFHHADLSEGVPFLDFDVDLAVASHFLEHLSYDVGLRFLEDLRRAMKFGAVVRIAVPDARLLAKSYADGDISKFDVLGYSKTVSGKDVVKFYELLAGPNHLSFYDADMLVDVLSRAGFLGVQVMKSGESRSAMISKEAPDVFPEISVYVEAVK
jgi:predicted SAM-dependent methyltransferase